MGIRQKQYAEELEKNLKAGKSLVEAHKLATGKAKVVKSKTKKPFPHLRKKVKTAKDVLPSKKTIAKYRKLGGRKTKEGRAFRRNWMKKHGG